MSRDLSGLSDRIGTLIREVRVQLESRFAEQVTRLEGLIRAVPSGRDGAPGERGERGEQGPIGTTGNAGPPGTPGVDGKDGSPGANGRDGANGIDGKDGKDGRDGAQGERGLPGESIQGPKGDTGERGVEGVPGKDAVLPDFEPVVQRVFESWFAKWAVDIERRAQDVLQRAIDKMPAPKDGRNALEIEDLEIVHEGHGNVTFLFRRGDLSRSFTVTIPSMEYFGVWREGQSYRRGNYVTWAGSLWHCQAASTTTKPGNGSTDWQLAVKRGEDGRSGKDGDRGPQGPAGRDGGKF